MSARATVIRLGKQSPVVETTANYERRQNKWAWAQTEIAIKAYVETHNENPLYALVEKWLREYQAQYATENPRRTYDKLVVANTKFGATIFHRGDYVDGDLAVFIPPGALLPENVTKFASIENKPYLVQNGAKNARWNWLRFKDGWHRVKPIRFAGVPSHGMVIPADPTMIEGQDVTEQLGILYAE